jgi:agmatine/peptidylarginine deiminase
MILEGGNIDFNQQGDLLTNLRSFQTNSQYQNNDEIAQHLKDVFSPRHLLALDLPPLQGDDTGGHIDTLARFINDDTIVYASCDDPYQADHSILQELKHQLEHQLQKHQSTHNTEYKILPMTMSSKTFKNIHGERCPASYVNFCFINEAVLVPQYDDEKDADAIQLLQQQLPMKKVIGINALALIEQFGSLHCATLHLPKGSL